MKFVLNSMIIILVFIPVQFAYSNESDYGKKEGWSVTGLPLINFSSDEGIGYGARLMIFNNGEKSDSRFKSAPYILNLSIQFFQTTEGSSGHLAEIDLPCLAGSKVRLKAGFIYDRSLNANYFGTSSNINGTLRDIYGNSYRRYSSYENIFLKGRNPLNRFIPGYPFNLFYKFNSYRRKEPEEYIDCFYDIHRFFRIYLGITSKQAEIDSWMGRKFRYGSGNRVISGPTLLDLDPHRYLEKQDGLINGIKAGIAFDTRDNESDPQQGLFFDMTVSYYSRYLGSDFSYIRFTAGLRGYYTILKRITFAARIAFTKTWGTVPFYEQGKFSFIMGDQSGLGNNRTLRGYRSDRFTGNTMSLANAELRLKICSFSFCRQNFSIKLVGFADTGASFNNSADFFHNWNRYRFGYGCGAVVVWNQNTVIHFYTGFSAEDRTFSVDFGHAI